eukprot:gnl/TRDRNA2_/TRDRNA2_183627_c0_seq1.p1 gnl/TRDRNA2_/TRDRNA2_183627_c0~~gnl/TRDRNA2_/TRDRNA2_183627_c0_seq1.p1  ORF type:complete len:186 (+),score=28.56 gnl/TRDRNA2_/TRDRNA2_183627_c0_seq1:73-558(+)
MALLGPQRFRQMLRPLIVSQAASRGIATSPVRGVPPLMCGAVQQKKLEDRLSMRGSKYGGVLLAGSPLFLTDLNVPMMLSEIQFSLSGPVNGMFESMFETEAGPLFLNAVAMVTLLRMATYYSFIQPSYLWNFQERYGQTWTVGHHLYGSDIPNPLKKVGK